MDSYKLADLIAGPIQVVGMSFYFDPGTAARAKELGLNVVQYYGLGRGGTLGDVDADVVFEAFTFFSPSAIDGIWTKPRELADPVTIASEHVTSAYVYADRVFVDIPDETLRRFAEATNKVIAAVPTGRHALVDGYRQYDPTSPRHEAYLGAILLRELRGGVHIDAVKQVGISPSDAAFLENEFVFSLHGYVEDDVSEVNDELREKKRRAEELTNEFMVAYFDVLTDEERQAIADGALAMDDAIKVAGAAS